MVNPENEAQAASVVWAINEQTERIAVRMARSVPDSEALLEDLREAREASDADPLDQGKQARVVAAQNEILEAFLRETEAEGGGD